jgi:hypothetical protein
VQQLMRSTVGVVGLLAAALLTYAHDGAAAKPPADRYRYQDLPRDAGFPTPEYVLLGDVLANDLRAIRRHAWGLWAALTRPSRSAWDAQRLPIFETWYSIPEVFNAQGKPGVQRTFGHRYHAPTQSGLAESSRGGAAAGLMSFVKYNEAAARAIWDNGYHLAATLDGLTQRFDRERTPIVERSIKPMPPSAVALKLVFWLVKRADSPQSERGLTALPYWDPAQPPPADGQPPMHTTWAKAVAIDPAGRYPVGSVQRVNVNGTRAKPNYLLAPVVPLSRFYSHRLSDPQEVADAQEFMNMLSSAGGEQERFVTNPGQTPELGDYVILLAMHVTTKEMGDWTFQTFWWTPTANDPPFGHDRPRNVTGPFANYAMCTAYSTVSPRAPDGGPPVCFNPYLETDLGPTKAYTLDGTSYPADPTAGTRTNCMNCHRRAGYPAFEKGNAASANFGRVFNDGFRSPDDPYFAPLVKTDFLWSIALKAVAPPKD